jgi:dipeptidyl aminopeptidase/acylaminoacyl peptidase
MLRSIVLVLPLLAVWTAGVGCARTRVVTITTDPPDAIIRVDNRDRGRGPITETFAFSGDVVAHTVSVRRPGYLEQVVTITPEAAPMLPVRLKPVSRQITVRVNPADAVVKLDGTPVPPGPSGEVRATVEFPLSASGVWTARTLTAEHPRFQPVSRTLTYDKPESDIALDLQAMRKDLVIATAPEGAEVIIDGQSYGQSPVDFPDFEFPVDEATNDFKPHTVRLVKPGFEVREETISWDDGRVNYQWTLAPQSKTIRIITDPVDATVVLGEQVVPLDKASGAHVYPRRIPFKLGADGKPATYLCVVSKKADDREWVEQRFPISWDEGQTEYRVTLAEVLTRPVAMLRVRTKHGAGAWSVFGERSQPLAMRDTGEGDGATAPVQITRLPKDTMIDTLAVAPDGSRVLFTTLEMTDATGELRSRIFTQPATGPADTVALTDGQSLELTPAYTPDGSQVVFASNRGGRKLSIWSVSASGDGGGAEQLTTLEANDLWPSVDSSPKPRLFYQSLLDTRAEPRLFSVQIGAVGRRDLEHAGTQPRVGPNADAVLFAAAPDPATGKRDIFRMSDRGDPAVNLTNTPDADEFDPAWSSDGRRVAYASDATRSAEQPDNRDVFVLDLTREGAEPYRVTTNGSWDDSPAWDARGRAIYFRSNRGGEWNVWRIDLK